MPGHTPLSTEQLIEALRPKRSADGAFENGDLVAAELEHLYACHPHELEVVGITHPAVSGAVLAFRNASRRTPVKDGHRLGADLGRFPIWAAFIPGEGREPWGVRTLRLPILILAVTDGRRSLPQPGQGDPAAGLKDNLIGLCKLTWAWRGGRVRSLQPNRYEDIRKYVLAGLQLEPGPAANLEAGDRLSQAAVDALRSAVKSVNRYLRGNVGGSTVQPPPPPPVPPPGPIPPPAPTPPGGKPIRPTRDPDELEDYGNFGPYEPTIPRSSGGRRRNFASRDTPPADLADGPEYAYAPDQASTGEVDDRPDLRKDRNPRKEPPVPRRDGQEISRRAAIVGHWLRLRDRLAMGSDYALVTDEAIVTTRVLLGIGEESVDPAQLQAAIELLVGLATSRGHVVLEATQIGSKAPSLKAPLVVRPDLQSWAGVIPTLHRHPWKPKTAIEREWVHPCAAFIELPFPSEILRLIEKLESIYPREQQSQHLLPMHGAAIQKARKELIWLLRDQVSPRITEPMIRGFLPASVFAQSQTRQLCQMITGESLGFSVAPLHYYAILQLEFDELYRKCLSKLFPSLRKIPVTAKKGAYFGAPLAVSIDEKVRGAVISLRREAESSRRHLAEMHAASARAQIRAQIDTVNAMTTYSASMYIAAMAHRNTYWLEKLTRRHFDRDLRICVDRDKVCDAGHVARVCALTDLVFNQIDQLIECYDGLRKSLRALSPELDERVVRPTLARIDDAISGEGPLFLAFNMMRGPKPVDRDWLKENFPQWKLPAHAFRPRLRHQLTALGVEAYEVDMQLGHFWGHQPFSANSERSVVDFAAGLRPKIAEQMKRDGWALLKFQPMEGRQPNPAALEIEPPRQLSLEPYEAQQREHDQLAKRRGVARAAFFDPPKDDIKGRYRLDLHRLLISREIETALGQLVEGYSPAAPGNGIAFDDAKVRSLLGKALGKVKVGFAAELATKMVRKRLSKLASDHHWEVKLPPPLKELPVLPSPIDLHCLSAYQTLKLLRVDFIDRFPAFEEFAKVVDGATRTSYLQFRLAINLSLDTGLIDPWQIGQCVSRIRQCRAPQKGLGMVLVPIRANPDRLRDETVALGGATALAGLALYEHLRPAKSSEERPADFSMAWFDVALEKLLFACHWIVHPAEKHSTADILRAIVKLGQRLELPGYVWGARSETNSSASLPIHRMLSILDDCRHPADPATRASPPVVPGPRAAGVAVVPLEHLFKQLVTLVNQYSGERSAVTPADRKNGLIESLKAFLETTQELSLNSNLVVKMLGEWCLYLATEKMPAPIQPKTIENQLYGIGNRLIKALGGRSLLDMESLELTHCIGLVAREEGSIRSKTHNERLGWIRSFYAFCAGHYDLAECEQSEVLTMSSQDASIDPSIVSEREFQQLLTIFDRWGANTGPDRFIDQTVALTPHVIRACRAMAILIFRVGLRPIEARRIRFCDLRQILLNWYVYIRPSQFGPLKTLGSKRFLCLTELLRPEELTFILSVHAESQRLVGDRGPLTPTFCDPRQPEFPIERRVVGALIGSGLQAVTGDPRARVYWMRHGFAHYAVTVSALPDSCGENIATRLTLNADMSRLPQRLPLASRLMGHVRLGTTFCYYFHLNEIAASYLATSRAESRTTSVQAYIYGVSDNLYRQRLHSARSKVKWKSPANIDLLCRSTGELSQLIVDQPSDGMDIPPLPSISAREATLSIRGIADLIWQIQKRKVTPSAAIAQWGVPAGASEGYRERITNLADAVGLSNLFPEKDGDTEIPAIPILRLSEAIDLAGSFDQHLEGNVEHLSAALDLLIQAIRWKKPLKIELRSREQINLAMGLLDLLHITYLNRHTDKPAMLGGRQAFPQTYDLDIDLRQIQVALLAARIFLDLKYPEAWH